ncbi:hypothetical protein AOLI_G00258240 [Acnodon oligacanthus]
MPKKARKQFAEDKQSKNIDYRTHVLWSDETKINLFGSDGVQHVWWCPDLNPVEHLWGILNWKVEERNGSNIHQLRDVIMEEWKRIPVATCPAAVVNSMPNRVKAVLDNNGGHTKY